MLKKLFFVLFLIPSGAVAQDCDITRFKNQIDFNLTAENYLHYTSVFQSRQLRDSRDSGKIRIDAFVEGLPVGIGGSKDSYDTSQSELFHKVGFRQNRKTSVAFVGNMLNDIGLSAYLACLQNHREGISASVLRADGNHVTVLYSYTKGQGDPNNASLDIELRGVVGNPETKIAINDVNATLVEYNRKKNSEFRVGLLSGSASLVGNRELIVDRQYRLPKGGQLLLVQAWADSNSYETAPSPSHEYRSEVMFIKPSDNLIKEYNHGGPAFMYVKVEDDLSYWTRINWRGALKGRGHETKLGHSTAIMENCDTPQACNYRISAMKLP